MKSKKKSIEVPNLKDMTEEEKRIFVLASLAMTLFLVGTLKRIFREKTFK